MLIELLKTDLLLFITTGTVSLSIFAAGFFYIIKKNFNAKLILKSTQPNIDIPQDLRAISGEDVFSTQLDLARAYIEIRELDAARAILDQVKKKGNAAQQSEAKELSSHHSKLH